MKWYFKVLKNYFNIHGRARRLEYWMFSFLNAFFALFIGLIETGEAFFDPYQHALGSVYTLYVLATFIPSWTVTIRRLHDVGKSGWMWLIVLVPIIGWIWLFILLVNDSQPGANKWGPNPKEEAELAAQSTTPPHRSGEG